LNLLFVNAVDWCASVKIADAATVTGKRGSAWAGSGDPQHAFGRTDPKESWGGWLTAIDADTGRVRWKYKSPTPMLAAVTPTAGGVVFTGDLNGDVLALDASNGSVLWRNATGAAMGGDRWTPARSCGCRHEPGKLARAESHRARDRVRSPVACPKWSLPNGHGLNYSLPVAS
jgi:glucose dehydrogenase